MIISVPAAFPESIEKAGAPEIEIEVTPELIEAGTKVMCNYYDDRVDIFTRDLVVVEIYNAMSAIP